MWRKSQANCIVGMGEKKKAKNDGLIDDDDRVDHKKSFHFPLCIVKLYYYYISGERDRQREIDIHTNICDIYTYIRSVLYSYSYTIYIYLK